EALEDIYEYPSIKGMILQNHAKCSSCGSTFPIVEENKKDYTCEFCDEYWCGNVDICGSKALELVNCASRLSFFDRDIAQELLGTDETAMLADWMAYDGVWDWS